MALLKGRTIEDEPITLERIDRALVTMAYIVVKHGPTYAPILDRLEREAEEMRRQEAPVDRARRLLEAYTLDGGRNAILSIQSRF